MRFCSVSHGIFGIPRDELFLWTSEVRSIPPSSHLKLWCPGSQSVLMQSTPRRLMRLLFFQDLLHALGRSCLCEGSLRRNGVFQVTGRDLQRERDRCAELPVVSSLTSSRVHRSAMAASPCLDLLRYFQCSPFAVAISSRLRLCLFRWDPAGDLWSDLSMCAIANNASDEHQGLKRRLCSHFRL